MKKEWWIVLLFLSVCAYAYAGGHARGSGFNEGVLEMADYPILFDESEDDPGIPNSDKIQLYAKDKAGTTTLYTQDALGTVTEVGAGGGSMVYPGAGIALSTGSVWDTSITNNSSNWNTAYGWGNHASAGYVTGTPWTSAGYITGISGSDVTTALGYTPLQSSDISDMATQTWIGLQGFVTGTPWTSMGYYIGDGSAFATAAQGSLADTALQSIPDLSATYLPLHSKADTAGTADAVTGLSVTAGQTLTVTTGGTLGSAAYTASTDYLASGGTAADSSKLNGQSASYYQTALTYPVTGVASPTAGYLTKWGASGNAIVDSLKIGTFTDAKWCSYTTASGFQCTENTPAGAGDVTQDQSTPQTIGATGARLAKLWATDVTSSSFTADGAGTDANSLMNNVGIGVASASVTAVLHLKAGTATAGTAPIKLTSGTNLTTPEAGVFEFDGTNLYFSV